MGKTGLHLHVRKIILAETIKDKQLKGCPVEEVILVRNVNAQTKAGTGARRGRDSRREMRKEGVSDHAQVPGPDLGGWCCHSS